MQWRRIGSATRETLRGRIGSRSSIRGYAPDTPKNAPERPIAPLFETTQGGRVRGLNHNLAPFRAGERASNYTGCNHVTLEVRRPTLAYTKTREALRIAREKYDLSYQEIADLCGVSLGSVKRWMLTGRAQEKAIQPLINQIGQVYLTASQVADHLFEIFKAGPRENGKGKSVRRFRVTDAQLAGIAGRQHIRNAFLEDLIDELREYGLLMVRGTGCFLVVSWQWLSDGCVEIQDSEIPDFYLNLAEDIDDEFEEDDMQPTKGKAQEVVSGMHFNQVRAIVGDEMRLFQAPESPSLWPRDRPKSGMWVLTGKDYSNDNSTTFLELDNDFNVVSIGRASFR